MSTFIIKGLPSQSFESYFSWSDEQLAKQGMKRLRADCRPGYPCRVSLQDAQVGEEVILLNYQHHQVDGPYRSNGPIFIRKSAKTAKLVANQIPEILGHRKLSLRAYDTNGQMVSTKVLPGARVKQSLLEMFDNQRIDYIHIHNAGPGCFNCEVRRICNDQS